MSSPCGAIVAPQWIDPAPRVPCPGRPGRDRWLALDSTFGARRCCGVRAAARLPRRTVLMSFQPSKARQMHRRLAPSTPAVTASPGAGRREASGACPAPLAGGAATLRQHCPATMPPSQRSASGHRCTWPPPSATHSPPAGPVHAGAGPWGARLRGHRGTMRARAPEAARATLPGRGPRGGGVLGTSWRRPGRCTPACVDFGGRDRVWCLPAGRGRRHLQFERYLPVVGETTPSLATAATGAGRSGGQGIPPGLHVRQGCAGRPRH